MIRFIAAAACVLFLFAGTALLADETMTHVTMTKSQRLKDCMEKQKSADVTQSKEAMKKFCKDQLKQQKASGELADPPPTDAPHN
jgi:hypothetical protein